MRIAASVISLLLVMSPVAAAENSPAASQYKALLAEYEQQGGARTFAKRFLELAETHADDPVAVDALVWVVSNVRGRAETTQALETLAKRHVNSDKLGSACEAIAASRSIAAEPLLRTVLAKSPHKNVRALACYHLAALLDTEAGIVEQLKARPELAPRILQYYGKEYGEHLAKLDAAKLDEEREQVYLRLLESFADVQFDDTTLGSVAERALFALRHLSVGRVAPEIKGQDIDGREFKLSDYRGKVVMLSFWGHW